VQNPVAALIVDHKPVGWSMRAFFALFVDFHAQMLHIVHL